MEKKPLNVSQQYEINRIATRCAEENPGLNFSTCYIITLFYYLMQYSGYKIDTIPEEYQEAVNQLYKSPSSSYIHYWSNIFNSKNEYTSAIKKAEIKEIGDDPRCPWL